MHQYKKNLTVLALLIAFTTAVVAVEVNKTSELQKGSFQGTHLQDGEIRLGQGAKDDALVGYWNFESKVPNKVVDASGNGNNGTLYGEDKNGKLKNFDFNVESGWVSGNGGNALRFDGSDDYVLLNNSDDFDVSEENELTISARIKSMEVRDEPYRYIFSNSRDCCGDYGGYNLKVDNDLTAEIWDGVDQETISYNYSSHFNKWTHVTFAATGSDLKIFVNGNLVKEAKQNLSIASPSFDSHIGALSYNPSLYNFNGSIDSLRLYNRSLSPSEISEVHSGKEDPREGLVGEWTFDSGSGSTAYDTSKWQQGVRKGKAIKFDGEDDLVNISSIDLSSLNQSTISFWLYWKGHSGNFILSSSYSDPDGRFESGGDDLRISTSDVSFDDGSANFLSPDNYMEENAWNFITVRQSNSKNQLCLLIDGVRENCVNKNFDYSGLDGRTFLGERTVNSAYSNVTIDNFRIYSRYLSDKRIKNLYNPSPGYFTSGFFDGGSTTRWNELNWTEDLAQNTEVEGRVQTASEVERTDNHSEWSEGTSSFSGPTDGLVGYWRFENPEVSGSGGTVKDWSGNGNDGTTKNGVNTSVEGFRPQSNAYDFELNDKISLPDENGQYPQYNITVSAWVNREEGGDIVDINYAASSDSSRESGIILDAGGATFTVESNTDEHIDVPAIEKNKWVHVAITRNSKTGEVKYYVDGRIANKTTLAPGKIVYEPATTSYDDDSVNIGYWNRSGWSGSGLSGKIDEIRIYNEALESSEIRSMYTSSAYTSDWIKADNINWAQWKQTKKGSDLEPVSQWRLDGRAQYVNDSLNRVQGTLGSGINEGSDDPMRINNCRFDECLSFDGDDDHVRFDSETYSDYAVTYWYYHTSSNGEQITGDSDRGWHWIEHNPSNNEISSQGAAGNVYSYNVPLETNSWHFVAYDYGEGELYHDGELVGTNPSQSISIQDIGTGGDSFWTGKIDDFRIYKSIDAEEAQALYNSPSQSFSSSSIKVRNRASDPWKSSLAGSWSFEGVGQTVVDFSGEGNTGSLGSTLSNEGSDPQRSSGYSGQAVKFDGNSWVETQYTDEPENITVSAWVKPSSVDTTDGVVGRIDDNGDQEDCYLGTRDGYWEFTCQMNPGGSDDWRETNSEALPSVGKWQHLVGRYDSAEEKLAIYINGNLEDEVNAPAPLHPTDNSNFQVGRWEYNDASQGLFEGKIDEVHVYNAALSSKEISELYSLSDFSSSKRGFTGSSLEVNNSGEFYQFKLNSITGKSKSVPEVESVMLADTSGWTDWSSSPGSSLDLGSSSFIQGQFNLSSTEPEESPELSAFSILEGLDICDERGPLNKCIVDAAHTLAAEIIDVASIFESKDSAELTASSGTATLNITNSSTLSGNWFGSFEIRSEDPTVKPGAEFKPENGDIVIGK